MSCYKVDHLKLPTVVKFQYRNRAYALTRGDDVISVLVFTASKYWETAKMFTLQDIFTTLLFCKQCRWNNYKLLKTF